MHCAFHKRVLDACQLPQQAIRRHLEMSDKPSGTFKGNLESYRFCDSVSLKIDGAMQGIWCSAPAQHSDYNSSCCRMPQLANCTTRLVLRLQVWNFVVQNAEFKLHVPGESMNIMVDVPKLHVVALDQKTLDPSVPGNG